MQNQLQVGKGVSFEGYKISYVCPRGDDFEWKEGLVLRYDRISGENDIKWKGGSGLSRHNMSTLQKDHPSIDFEKCSPSDPLWTEDAKSAWNRYTDEKKTRPRGLTPNYAEGEEEEVEEEPPPRRQRREKLPPMEFLCPINLALMRDPVVCQDGYTYERNAILDWKRQADLTGTPFTSPMTGAIMGHGEMYPNHFAKWMISTFKP